jgi:hypothetical protein
MVLDSHILCIFPSLIGNIILIRALNQLKVDILRVEVEEPSLEEIFLEA